MICIHSEWVNSAHSKIFRRMIHLKYKPVHNCTNYKINFLENIYENNENRWARSFSLLTRLSLISLNEGKNFKSPSAATDAFLFNILLAMLWISSAVTLAAKRIKFLITPRVLFKKINVLINNKLISYINFW